MLSSLIKANVLVVVLLSLGFLPTPTEAAINADARLKKRVEELYRQRTNDYGWYYRLVFAAVSDAIAARVVHECEQQQCKDAEINQAIQQRVYHVGKHAAAAATYGIVFAGIMLSAYGGAKFSHFLSKRNISEATRSFISVFVPIVTGMGVFSIGAPLWDPARSFIRRWAFANNQFSNKPDTTKYPPRPDLEEHWMNTLSAFLVLVSPSLQDIRSSYAAGRYEYAAAQLAKCLVQLRYVYSELAPDQPILLASVRSYFRNLKLSPQFMQQVVDIALILDPLAPSDSDYYEQAVRIWLSEGGNVP